MILIFLNTILIFVIQEIKINFFMTKNKKINKNNINQINI